MINVVGENLCDVLVDDDVVMDVMDGEWDTCCDVGGCRCGCIDTMDGECDIDVDDIDVADGDVAIVVCDAGCMDIIDGECDIFVDVAIDVDVVSMPCTTSHLLDLTFPIILFISCIANNGCSC